MTLDRIFSIRCWGIWQPVIRLLSTTRSPPSHRTAQPKYRSISAAASTSSSRGQQRMRQALAHKMVALRMGSTLFFAPCTAISPRSGLPPAIRKWLKPLPPFHRFTPSYAQRRERGAWERIAIQYCFYKKVYFTSAITVR